MSESIKPERQSVDQWIDGDLSNGGDGGREEDNGASERCNGKPPMEVFRWCWTIEYNRISRFRRKEGMVRLRFRLARSHSLLAALKLSL